MKKRTVSKASEVIGNISILTLMVGIIGAIWSSDITWHNIWLTSLVVFVFCVITYSLTKEDK